eukprot:GEMP01037642.1.p1 GENE.GEMP01037642.1~~GEMP01037642.1.p1  ORF type:complete len:501 (+),score=72.38 GEMP01037642.1:109-1503(+)
MRTEQSNIQLQPEKSRSLMLTRRVLSVQSHVVHGYVGNKCAVFPLQLLGFDVDSINTVQFCNHTGYPRFAGQVLDGQDIQKLADGLESNGLLNYSHLLTGYIGSKGNLEAIADLVSRLRQKGNVLSYVCDPVLGDNGKLYVARELVSLYREKIVPLCTVLTPNQFEAECLTDVQIHDVPSALEACRILHDKGVETIVLTTLNLESDERNIHMLLSTTKQAHGSGKWLLGLPTVPSKSPFTGTGDLTSALLLAWISEHSHEVTLALEKTAATMQKVLENTVRCAEIQDYEGKLVPPELSLIHSKKAIEDPEIIYFAKEIRAVPHQWEAVVFDMDGTLTVPGQIDFKLIRKLVEVPEGDILTAIEAKPSQEERDRCVKIVEEMELAAFTDAQIRPGVKDELQRLKKRGIKLALLTRNMSKCVDIFIQQADVADIFDEIITRDTPINEAISALNTVHQVVICCSFKR